MALVMDCPRCWGKKKACALCKGSGKRPDRQLSEHFKLSELLDSPTARARGLANDPTPEIEANLELLAKNLLEPIRELCGPLSINSGYRSDAVNKAVGGSTTSAHSYGLAADLNPVNIPWKECMDRVISAKVSFDQLIFEHTWVHAGFLNPKTRKQRGDTLVMFKGPDGAPTYEKYDPNDPRVK